jgi:hypothetical protein
MVTDYYTPADSFHYAIGHRLDKPEEQVRVRLNTVDERHADKPDDSIDKIKSLYVTGENTRDTLADKAKAGVRLLSFDDARKVSAENGVTEYRAHWPKTIATEPSAETVIGMAHVRLRDAVEIEGKPRKAAQAYIEMFKGAAVVNAENIDAVLKSGLSIKDEQNRSRDPLVILRVFHEGKQVAAPRIYPAMKKDKVFDQGLGQHKDISVKVDADETIGKVMAGGPGRDDFETRQLDTVRALVAGLKGLDEPKFASADDAVRDSIRNLYYGAKAGALQVEVISAEKIDFGADSRKTYLANKNRPPMVSYEMREQNGDDLKQSPGFTKTVVAFLRHPDGEPYAVFAAPTQMYPQVKKLADLPMQAVPVKELAKEVSNDTPDPEPSEGVGAPEPAEEPVLAGDESRYDDTDGPAM